MSYVIFRAIWGSVLNHPCGNNRVNVGVLRPIWVVGEDSGKSLWADIIVSGYSGGYKCTRPTEYRMVVGGEPCRIVLWGVLLHTTICVESFSWFGKRLERRKGFTDTKVR